MKKVVIIVCLFCVLFVGCTKQHSNKNDTLKNETNVTYNTHASDCGAEYQISDGVLYGKGEVFLGVFGNTFEYYKDWVQVLDFDNIIHIQACNSTLIFLTNDGKVYGLGSSEGGVLKIQTNEYNNNGDFVVVPILLFENCKYTSLGVGFALFIKEDNTLWFLGTSKNGQSMTVTDAIYEPIQIAENVQYAKAFGYTSAFIDDENSLYLFGDNSYGQIGNGSSGCGYPTLYNDIVTTPYCALKHCKSVSAINHSIVQAETIDGIEYIWGGDYGPSPVIMNESNSLSVPE